MHTVPVGLTGWAGMLPRAWAIACLLGRMPRWATAGPVGLADRLRAGPSAPGPRMSCLAGAA